MSSGGALFVLSGGTASDTTVSSSGFLIVLPGGTQTSTTLSGGAIASTGVIVDEPRVGFTQYGDVATDVVVSSGGAEYILPGASAISTTVSSDATEVIYSGGLASLTSVNVGGDIDVTYFTYVSGGSVSANSATDVLTVSQGGQTYTQQLSGDYATDFFQLAQDSDGGTLINVSSMPCYCRGTHILSQTGEILIEQLGMNDLVLTANGTPRPIRWIGSRHLNLLRHPDAALAQPILIHADAIAGGVPHRDLRVSPDHAVLIDGMLIPARLLINGASIHRESDCHSVTYYHVELDAHDVLLAENLPAESYLDTGNRGMFDNADTALILHPDFNHGQARRVAESCRPFVDDPARVKPIWQRLAIRAATLGFDLPAAIETTTDPALRIVIGEYVIKPVSTDRGRYAFVLPTANGPAHLVSRAARPCDLRPWVEDRRRLGVMVSRLILRRGGAVESMPLDHPQLSSGWWDIECDQANIWRWTDGNAAIPLSGEMPAVLEIVLAGSPNYPLGGHSDVCATGRADSRVAAA